MLRWPAALAPRALHNVAGMPPAWHRFLRCLSTPPPLPPQYDVHMPLLTVHETLLFARRCMWASGCKNMMEAEAEKVGSCCC